MKPVLARLAHGLVAALTAAATVLSSVPAGAQSGRERLPVVRDAEIEALIRDYAAPLLQAAGLSASRVEIILVNDLNFNAFVAGRRIFINTGTILQSETPNETIGVIAHEIGHLAGGHQERLRDQIARAQTIAIVAGLLGAGVAAAGAASGSGAAASAGAGVMTSGGGIAQRGLFAYQRSEETTADRSALTYLERTGQSPRGLLESFEGLARSNLLSGVRSDRYLTSHPAPQDRIGFLQTAARASPHFDRKDPAERQLRHDLARAKIAAYNGGAGLVRQTFGRDLQSLAPRYGDAIATHLSGSPAQALQKVDGLIAAAPRNAYFHEVRGEILMGSGRSAEAAAAFSRAAELDPSNSGIIRAAIGQALVTGRDPAKMPEAIAQIRRGLQSEPNNAMAHRFLAMAYGVSGNVGAAELATAEGYWHAGRFRDAKVFAARAQGKFRPGTAEWQRADDIIQTR
ncbi:M48 family metalloprotease [Aureimonas populi]|uniref:M48 family metalloprotease n=1 Tax=Aureimonas populi TaxID=1701758 RepID=A0ABW5CLU5_9HYPH|nr:M48 family metalloprotease [Aureimonas populi]